MPKIRINAYYIVANRHNQGYCLIKYPEIAIMINHFLANNMAFNRHNQELCLLAATDHIL